MALQYKSFYVTFFCRYHMLQVNRGQIIYPDYNINVSRPLFESCGDFEK